MKKILAMLMLALLNGTAMAQESGNYKSNVVAEEGAWCWFADPRALHYENEAKTINASYLGYIDVHGNVKATQYDWLTGRKTDVLIRSYFQPDDHNNPTFVILPDERVMIFYTRHTDEPKIWYRISRHPGDITNLGEEKYLSTANNTTYPSPFILSDDPTHIYLCWRGINWHPTIARLTMPDQNDNCQFDFGPKQIVQSTGARPYAKYQSNGKDKIYLAYTTGHPDNEQPDWLYFNVIDINQGNGPILRDINGTQLSIINNGVFNVSKQSSYASNYPLTIVDNTSNIRNWVWQIALDEDEHPVIAYPHIDDAKTSHVYWYARWTGSAWRRTWVQYGGHAFHQNWNSTERCYSGGMALDPDNINDLYLSIPTKNGAYNKDGVYEIWKYTIDDEGNVASSEQLTSGSPKNNVRPFILPGSKNSPLRLAWMQGDYYYWMVQKSYPLGYPTRVMCNYEWTEDLTLADPIDDEHPLPDCICFSKGGTLHVALAMNENKYEGKLLSIGDTYAGGKGLTYSLNATTKRPEVTINGKTYTSQNALYTSDNWATMSTGTSGDNHPTKVSTWVLSMTYDGHILTTYRNGVVDQVIETEDFEGDTVDFLDEEDNHAVISYGCLYYVCQTPASVQRSVEDYQKAINDNLAMTALNTISLPAETRTDLVLPTSVLGQTINWTSSNEKVIANGGTLKHPTTETVITLTATCGEKNRQFSLTALPRDLEKSLRYSHDEILDLTANTAAGFATNHYEVAPEGLLNGLRSFSFLLKINAKSLSSAPRFYDFGSASGNSLFLRANPLSAGVKYNGGTTTMVTSSTTLSTGKDYLLAVTFDAATKMTRIYIDGQENVSGTANQVEAYQLAQLAADTRNYIGRTQWWDSSYKADNVDFVGLIQDFKLYDICLTRKEICQLQGVEYDVVTYPEELTNGDFEDTYTKMQGSGVNSDRAIYQPKGWSIDYTNRNNNDLTALKTGDLLFSNFFASLAKPASNGNQTYWVRQNWGESTITLFQDLTLPEGQYTLKADVWKSGLGGNALIFIDATDGQRYTLSPAENKTAWQQVEQDFESDGENATRISLSAMHNSNGSEKIIGFDNIALVLNPGTGIYSTFDHSASHHGIIYDLQGRRVEKPNHGIYIQDGKKIVR